MDWSLLLEYSRGLDIYKDIDVIFVSLSQTHCPLQQTDRLPASKILFHHV